MNRIRQSNSSFGTDQISKAENSAVAAAKTAASGASSSSGASIDSDSSVVSSLASALTQVIGTSDVRFDKVEQIKTAIASGQYNVPPSAVADKLVQSLLGGSR